MREALDRDKSLVELRALLASYEERLSRSAVRSPADHAARFHIPEPVFLVNDLAIDLRSAALESREVLDAPPIVDCNPPEEPEPFSFVHKVKSGVFRVHPRPGRATAAVIGPFGGPPPSGLIATAATAHGAAPPVRFHIGIWPGEVDTGKIRARLNDAGRGVRFLTVPPRHQGYLIVTDLPRSGQAPATSYPGWSLLLATMADPPEEIGYAWADFSDIHMVFSTDRGSEVRLLS
jgi:hypothetical protein